MRNQSEHDIDMVTRTLRGDAAADLTRLVYEMRRCAEVLRLIRDPQAQQHADELAGAAKMVVNWSRELRRQHREILLRCEADHRRRESAALRVSKEVSRD